MSDWRWAEPADAVALTGLERDANVVALAHVFPLDTQPFPFDGVLARWRSVLADNHRARGLDDHLGWRPTELTRTAEWSPYPVEIEYARIGA